MLSLGAIGFASPALLAALLALPVLWWLLRAVPPAPVQRRFPGISLLLGLRERDPESQRTPWWLLALRIAALAALILALAGPVLNPRTASGGNGGPLLIVMDASWASARDWPRHSERAAQALTEARRDGRPVAVVALTAPPAGGAVFRTAEDWQERLPGVAPAPYAPLATQDWTAQLPASLETLWISDGLAHEGRRALHDALAARGPVTIAQPEDPVLALVPPQARDGVLDVTLRRVSPTGISAALPATDHVVIAQGLDPSGTERDLARLVVGFAAGAGEARAVLDLPPEQRNRITRFQIEGARGAGAVALADDSLQRRKIGLLTVRENTEQLALLSPLHYLRQALAPGADLFDGTDLSDLLLAAPDVVVLADIPTLTEAERIALTTWVERGGLLLRFAGPRLAGVDRAPGLDDPLLPVALRAGGRTVGGAMSWGEPRQLAPFRQDTPFAGLDIPADVEIRAQVLAQPGPELAVRSIAELTDGTPLVTRRALGAGQVVLFHVTANADWSNLPLSGLFVQMLDRLAVSTRAATPAPADLAGTRWTADRHLDGFGQLRPADGASIPGALLAEALTGSRAPGPDLLPGLYARGDQRLALNAVTPRTPLAPADWPAGTRLETGVAPAEQPLAGLLLTLAAVFLALDVLATLALGGRLMRVAGTMLALALCLPPPPAQAADLERALLATEAVVLALVPSGDARVDDVALAGLRGLSTALFRRSSVEPAPPMVIDLDRDELALFPFLYWPVTENSPLPSAQANAALNRYLRSGGLILFDTRDAEVVRLTGTSPAQRRLRQIAAGLDIPALEPMPPDHVLTRTFYLLNDFPGRQTGGDIWVEAAPPDTSRAEGMPFRILNDGVTPVVFGANDWAAAWAVDAAGMPMLPVGRGITGERQRELALRFGINLIMHVLSGNYKSDQVHVPELLQRLGN